MKQGTFITVLLIVAFAMACVIYFYMIPQFIRDGGPLVIALITLSIMVITFIVERILSLRKAQGKAAISKFLVTLEKHLSGGDLDAAISACDAQRGSLANIVRTGLTRFREIAGDKSLEKKERMTEVQRVIEEATMLEMPILEKNLVALSTIASISTMIGLLGTVIGMIRSFQALAHAGAPDAIQLSIGISEALINTAGGLFAAISAIVAYNFFVTKIDNLTYMIDEASYNVLQHLQTQHEK